MRSINVESAVARVAEARNDVPEILNYHTETLPLSLSLKGSHGHKEGLLKFNGVK